MSELTELDCCSFCGREESQSHTEDCPARVCGGEYVERFEEAVKAIGGGIDRRDAAITELCASLDETHKWVRRIQDVMVGYLVPDGYDADEALNRLIEMLDGPEQRAIQGRALAALAKARGNPCSSERE
jgi:hypothetical protein